MSTTKVILVKPFHVKRGKHTQLVADITGRPIGVRMEGDVVYLDFVRGAMALSPSEYDYNVKSGNLQEQP